MFSISIFKQWARLKELSLLFFFFFLKLVTRGIGNVLRFQCYFIIVVMCKRVVIIFGSFNYYSKLLKDVLEEWEILDWTIPVKSIRYILPQSNAMLIHTLGMQIYLFAQSFDFTVVCFLARFKLVVQWRTQFILLLISIPLLTLFVSFNC